MHDHFRDQIKVYLASSYGKVMDIFDSFEVELHIKCHSDGDIYISLHFYFILFFMLFHAETEPRSYVLFSISKVQLRLVILPVDTYQ